ncbi:MAG: GNAT family N-acetyltransferase [Acidimicrobiia bacterium]|nr:GNAT family N-acetyltransferase [Acidimicrobiia bacterium]
MEVDSCSFTTARLAVRDWQAAPISGRDEPRLADIVAGLLTDAVTRHLPADWQGPYTPPRASRWIAERDAEGPVLLVADRETGEPLGLLLLFEYEHGEDGVEVRLGYLLAERAWGRGLATELITGFVAWCRTRPTVRSVVGGVEPGNEASIRVLERCGFERLACDPGEGGELFYALRLGPGA